MQKIVPLTRMRDESGHDVPMSGTNRGGGNCRLREEFYKCQEMGDAESVS